MDDTFPTLTIPDFGTPDFVILNDELYARVRSSLLDTIYRPNPPPTRNAAAQKETPSNRKKMPVNAIAFSEG